MFRKAQRQQARLKIGISAPSGAGKTYSALLIAKGICGDWEKIAVIDTENRSADLYSDLGAYSVCNLTPPYTPDKYINAIKEAQDAGFEVLIIDSLSHAWNGEGGLLDMQDKAKASSKSGNGFTAWREITPLHNKLVNSILQCDMDVIITTRAKSDYVITEENGKKDIKKMGLAPIFREGLEFELTTFFDLSQAHVATASKDRTGLFDGKNFIPSEETGRIFSQWRESAEPAKKSSREDEVKALIKDSGVTMDDVKEFITALSKGQFESLDDLSEKQYKYIISQIKKSIEAAGSNDE